MPERVDLDAAEALFNAGNYSASTQHARRRTGLALVAALRVAREVAEADRWATESETPERIMRVKRARVAYREWCDRHDAPSTPDPSEENTGSTDGT